jgi:hypothetical protein
MHAASRPFVPIYARRRRRRALVLRLALGGLFALAFCAPALVGLIWS